MKRQPAPEHAGPVQVVHERSICPACLRCWKTEGKTTIPKCIPWPKHTRYYG